MNKFFSAAIILIVLNSCNGGSCEYKDFPFKATIVSIERDTLKPYSNPVADNDSVYKIKLVSTLEYHDSLELSQMTKQNITGSFLAQHHLTKGTTLEGIAHLRTSGTCEPG